MRKKLLSLFISTLFLINLFYPVSAFAAPQAVPQNSLNYTTRCDGDKSMISFSWQYDADWDNADDLNRYYLKFEGDSDDSLIEVASPEERQVNQNDANKRWIIRRCDPGEFRTGANGCIETSSTYTARKCSISGPDDPVLGPGECGVKVSTVGGSDETNPELISLTIDTNGLITPNKEASPDPNKWSSKYNVQIEGSTQTCGDDYVRGKDGCNKFEFNNFPDESSYYGGNKQFISSAGIISIDSLDKSGRVTNAPNGSWDDKSYNVKVFTHGDLGGVKEVCSSSFNLGKSDPGKCTKNSDCFSNKCNANGKCALGTTKLACAIVNVKEGSDGTTTDADFICNTAIGPFSADAEGFAKGILRIMLGLAGGILLLLIIINGYKLMTSQGDPERIKDAREGIIAAILGILLIIFSLSILQLIVIDVIGIPGFSR